MATAVEWYERAAAHENASAQFNLGLAYKKGVGVTQDNTKALEWYNKAATQGHIAAQDHIKRLEMFGR